MRKLKQIRLPMNSKIENKTLSVYTKINNVSITLFLIVLQVVYVFEETIMQIIPELWFTNTKFRDIIIGILISSITFTIIYSCVFILWQKIWKYQHLNNCYISGNWCHVFDREIDDNTDYVRAGWLVISQNFYDIEVTAHNYYISLEGDKLVFDPKNISKWHFTLSELNNSGDIFACFEKETGYKNSISNTGIMKLSTYSYNVNDIVTKMDGTFMDAGKSLVKGNIKLFKAPNNFIFMENNPTEWEIYIIKELESRRKNV